MLFEDWDEFTSLSQSVQPADLLVVVMARSQSVSWLAAHERVPQRLVRYFASQSFLLVYPEQHEEAYTPI